MLIVIEGWDGCGKDTVANAVASALGFERLNFPNDAGYTGPAIRAYLRGEWDVLAAPHGGTIATTYPESLDSNCHLSALTFQALQIANRMEVMPRLEKAANNHTDLILARYWQSAIVYGTLDGLDPAALKQMHESMVRADLNILLDIDAETALARRAARDGALPPERYEGKLALARKGIDLYRSLWGSHGNPWWPVIDARRPVEKVIADVLERVSWLQ